MPFVSATFIAFIFSVVLVYYVTPKKHRWVVLLLASYIFYYLNSKWLLLVLFFESIVAFVTAFLIQQNTQRMNQHVELYMQESTKKEKKAYQLAEKKKRKTILAIGIVIILGILLLFKYYNFFIMMPVIRSVSFPHLHLLLPIGISFYSLQAIAYTVDVYRGKSKSDENFFHFLLFMSYFPQIVQGPIAKHSQLAKQLYEGHDFDYRRFCFGAQLILWGFIKKLVIADRIALPVKELYSHYGHYSGFLIFCAAAGYGIQVYADFSGGMDIARGFSQMLGIELELNFTQPYFSTSVEDFWRRWHITLGGFMRDYVFYPLSLSKVFVNLGKRTRKTFGNSAGKKIPSFIAMFSVYFLVGLWHGSDWKYVFYGVWNGVFIASGILLSDFYRRIKSLLRIQEGHFYKGFQILRTFFVVSLGRIFSNADSWRSSISMFHCLRIRWFDFSALFDGTLTKLGLNTANWILLCVSIVILLYVDALHEKSISIREYISMQNLVFRWCVYLSAVMIVIVFGMYGPGYTPGAFIYQQF